MPFPGEELGRGMLEPWAKSSPVVKAAARRVLEPGKHARAQRGGNLTSRLVSYVIWYTCMYILYMNYIGILIGILLALVLALVFVLLL